MAATLLPPPEGAGRTPLDSPDADTALVPVGSTGGFGCG